MSMQVVFDPIIMLSNAAAAFGLNMSVFLLIGKVRLIKYSHTASVSGPTGGFNRHKAHTGSKLDTIGPCRRICWDSGAGRWTSPVMLLSNAEQSSWSAIPVTAEGGQHHRNSLCEGPTPLHCSLDPKS